MPRSARWWKTGFALLISLILSLILFTPAVIYSASGQIEWTINTQYTGSSGSDWATGGSSATSPYGTGSYLPGSYGSYGTSSGSGSATSSAAQVDQSSFGLWIGGNAGKTKVSYISVPEGSSVPLVSYSPAGGSSKLYDVWEAAGGLKGTITSLNLPSGTSQGDYQAGETGRHTLLLHSGTTASNLVIIDVGLPGAGSSQFQGQSAAGSYSGQSTGSRSVSINTGYSGQGVYSDDGLIQIIGIDSGFGSGTPSQDDYGWGSLYGDILIDSADSGFMSDVPAGSPI